MHDTLAHRQCRLGTRTASRRPPAVASSTARGPARSRATPPRAPGHERPPAALSAARHGRLSAAMRAPGPDVPRATPAWAPGQGCLSAVRAPGHDRPSVAPMRAAGRGRPCAIRAPGPDVPRVGTTRAPGQDRLSAVKVPGPDQPHATPSWVAGPDRPCATTATAAAAARPHVVLPSSSPGYDCPRQAPAGAGLGPTSRHPTTAPSECLDRSAWPPPHRARAWTARRGRTAREEGARPLTAS